MWQTYNDRDLECGSPDTPVWIMAIGGACVGLGVILFGERVMRTMGENITEVCEVDMERQKASV